MPINLMPGIVLWALVTTVVLVLFVWRVMVTKGEPRVLHVAPENEEQMVEVREEVKLARKLDVIDRWGKVLTIVSAVLVLAVGAAWVYNGWLAGSTTTAVLP